VSFKAAPTRLLLVFLLAFLLASSKRKFDRNRRRDGSYCQI
jgi:hypothetical protein